MTKPGAQSKFESLFRWDVKYLLDRLEKHIDDSIHLISAKGTRDHIPQIFRCHYHHSTPRELGHCSEEFIKALMQLHDLLDQLCWYLLYSDDMPGEMKTHAAYRLSQAHKLKEFLHLDSGETQEDTRYFDEDVPPFFQEDSIEDSSEEEKGPEEDEI